ncbi:MAG: peptidoglycan recognition family protein [Oliverpabstia sp.]|nr:N-acetylmuramoyl-L-alanine amidase [Lachnospiraceae bacterium]MDY5026025.1 peptidoglycan recognition family protein [Oliverpabstia sp.]
MGNQRRRRGKNSRSYNRRYRMSRQRRKRQLMRRAVIALTCAFICIVAAVIFCRRMLVPEDTGIYSQEEMQGEEWIGAPNLNVDLLSVNEYSRPGIALAQVRGIVIHYTANPGSSAKANRDYFEGLKDAQTTKASSHFIIGLEGEIIQCIPSTEISYASNDRNKDTLSIECCHPDETGQFNASTYQSMVDLTGWLCQRFGLTSQDVIRHYDVTGKLCPKYFVEHEDAWEQFRADVDAKIEEIEALK